MDRPFNDHYSVVNFHKAERGTRKAFLLFRSQRTNKLTYLAELHADEVAVWIEMPGDVDLYDPKVMIAYSESSSDEKLRIWCNHGLKQYMLTCATTEYLRLPHKYSADVFDGLRRFLLSRAWRQRDQEGRTEYEY